MDDMIRTSACGCGRAFVPPRKRCPACGAETADAHISGTGEVLTYTTVHAVPEGFAAPLNLALVLLGNNCKLLCESRCSKIKIGKKVRLGKDGDKFYCTD